MRRKYKYINQKKNNCFAVTLKMILDRKGLKRMGQDNIASFFERNELGALKIKDINKQFFEPNNIPLKEKFFNLKELEMTDPGLDKIKERFDNSDNDYIVFTNYSSLTLSPEELSELIRNDDEKVKIFHCFLIEGIKDRDHVTLVNPETAGKGGTSYLVTTLDRIFESMDLMSSCKNSLGISEISNKL